MATSAPHELNAKLSASLWRADRLFQEHLHEVHERHDRVFAWLMAAQWLFGLLLAFFYAPSVWAEQGRQLHSHVFHAVFIGGALSGSVILLALLRPGWVVTRHAAAISQMLWSGLLVHLTGGQIGTHFHAFGSLAILAYYRDWKVLRTATVVIVLNHLLRGLFWPEPVYGLVHPEWWPLFEHVLWIAFEDVVLMIGVVEIVREMRSLAIRRASMEALHASIEQKVVERTQELAASREQYRSLVETTRTVPWQFDLALERFTYVGPQGAALLGCSVEDWLQPGFREARIHPDDLLAIADRRKKWREGGGDADLELRLKRNDGTWVWVRSITGRLHEGQTQLSGFMLDITDRRRMETELQQAQKLESVGRLASGIAHEINTPVQFVNDSVYFVREAVDGLLPLLGKYAGLRDAAALGPISPQLMQEVREAEEAVDVQYLAVHLPKALERSVEGLKRVATLVRSMKEFAHPDQRQKAAADLNHALSTTLTLARNEYKYVADVETDFGDLPQVLCHLSDLNQVFLNIIVNAAHAIEDVVKGTERKGLIRIATRREADGVLISISDSGSGIPESIRASIFDPFFTTKEVGKGTGQGLAIARNVVMEKHGGSLTFESEVGCGTTFFVRLPIGGEPRPASAEAA
jgi:PAS domain S-box-containing protein